MRQWVKEGKKVLNGRQAYAVHLNHLIKRPSRYDMYDDALTTEQIRKLEAMAGPHGYAMYCLLVEQRWGEKETTNEQRQESEG